jgi:hypothetical protein
LHQLESIGDSPPRVRGPPIHLYPLTKRRTNTIGAVARIRNALAFATHSFFQGRGFYYVHTPIITASDCEGAGEMFAVRARAAGRALRQGGVGPGPGGLKGPSASDAARPLARCGVHFFLSVFETFASPR